MVVDNLVYLLDKKVYLNLTNKCTNDCVFCIRSLKDDVCGKNLWLKSEDFSAADVIEQLKNFSQFKEFVFCGYGEPLLKLELLKEVAQYIKQNFKDAKIRINTNGHANFVYKRNILPELVWLIDEISVSLNAESAELYDEISRPVFSSHKSQVTSHEIVKDFIKKSVEAGIKTVASVVDGYKDYKIDIKKCEEITKSLGAEFRVREWLDNGY